jgi:general secretion pathway protein G
MNRNIRRLLRRARRLTEPAKNDEGWTFIEIIVVLAIILILSGTVGFATFRFTGQARVSSAKDQIQNLALALNSYALDTGSVPSPDQGFSALWNKPSGDPESKNWRGPYLEKAPGTDPWGNDFRYQVPGPNGLPFGILCLGADGSEGGEGDNADIASWQ